MCYNFSNTARCGIRYCHDQKMVWLRTPIVDASSPSSSRALRHERRDPSPDIVDGHNMHIKYHQIIGETSLNTDWLVDVFGGREDRRGTVVTRFTATTFDAAVRRLRREFPRLPREDVSRVGARSAPPVKARRAVPPKAAAHRRASAAGVRASPLPVGSRRAERRVSTPHPSPLTPARMRTASDPVAPPWRPSLHAPALARPMRPWRSYSVAIASSPAAQSSASDPRSRYPS